MIVDIIPGVSFVLLVALAVSAAAAAVAAVIARAAISSGASLGATPVKVALKAASVASATATRRTSDPKVDHGWVACVHGWVRQFRPLLAPAGPE